MSKGEVKVPAITAFIDPDKCTACGMCARICPYHAIEGGKEQGYYQVIQAACQGCGACVPECKFGAVDQTHFTEQQIISQIDSLLANDPHSKILVFACNWCSYAGADFAGVSRIQYPPSVPNHKDHVLGSGFSCVARTSAGVGCRRCARFRMSSRRLPLQ